MATGLQNSRVIITAAATGIGRVTAEMFLAAGARVEVCDVDEPGLKGFKSGHPAVGVTVTDVAEEAQLNRFLDTAVANLGGLDIIINNAGIAGPTANVEDVKPEDWRRTLAVNLDATYLCCRRVCGAGPTYITFDIDGLDPVYCIGTGVPEPGGLSMRDAQVIIRGLQGMNLIGGDICEVLPLADPTGHTALNAANLMFEMLCVIADSRVSRN